MPNIIALILSLTFWPLLTVAQLTNQQSQFVTPENILDNPGFQNGKTKWAVSTGSWSVAGSGLDNYASWDASASTQTFCSDLKTVPDRLKGKNGAALLNVSVPSGTATHKIEVRDGSANILAPDDIFSNDQAVNNIVNFIFPTSGTVRVCLVAQADEPAVRVYNGIIADATHLNIGNASVISGWTTVTISMTHASGTWTNTTVSSIMRRVGDKAEFKTRVTANGAVGTFSQVRFTLPAGLTLNSAEAVDSSRPIGRAYCWDAAPVLFLCEVRIDSSGNIEVLAATAPTTATQGVAFITQAVPFTWASGDRIQAEYSVRIAEWSGTASVFRADTVAQSGMWAFDSNCSWARTNTALGDPATDASCTLIQVSNVNMGTVTIAGGANTLPGIIWTAKSTGDYKVCFTILNIVMSAGAIGGTTIDINGTDYVQSVDTSSGASTYLPGVNYCATLRASAGTQYTAKLQTRAGSGSITVAGAAIPYTSFVTIEALSVAKPAPLIENAVVSSYTGVTGVEWVAFGGATEGTNNCAASPCTVYRRSPGVTSVTRGGTGLYDINFSAGTFSSAPVCVAVCNIIASANCAAVQSASTLATSVLFRMATIAPATGALTDAYMMAYCIGPR